MAKYVLSYQAYDKRTNVAGTPKVYRCGRIVNKQDIDTAGICQMAIDSGDLKALNLKEAIAFAEVLDATKTRAMYEGKRVKTPHCIMQYNLAGQLGANDSITSATRLVLNVTARADGKPNKGNISFTNIGKLAAVAINSICSIGSEKSGVIIPDTAFTAVGDNLTFRSEFGDKVEWMTASGTSGEVDVTASQDNMLTLAWNEAWAELTEGTAITLTFTLHGGDPAAVAKTIVKTVTIGMAE